MRIFLRILGTLVGLALALLALAPAVFIGDPAADSSRLLRALTVWGAVIASWLTGSLALSLVTTPLLAAGLSRRLVATGAGLVAAAVALFVATSVYVRDSFTLELFPLCLLLAYLGGALMLGGARRSRRATGRGAAATTTSP